MPAAKRPSVPTKENRKGSATVANCSARWARRRIPSRSTLTSTSSPARNAGLAVGAPDLDFGGAGEAAGQEQQDSGHDPRRGAGRGPPGFGHSRRVTGQDLKVEPEQAVERDVQVCGPARSRSPGSAPGALPAGTKPARSIERTPEAGASDVPRRSAHEPGPHRARASRLFGWNERSISSSSASDDALLGSSCSRAASMLTPSPTKR